MSSIYDYSGKEIVVSGSASFEPMENDIPIVEIDGELPTSKWQGELPVKITYKSLTTQFTNWATLKVQGDSSTQYPKKNFTLKMFSNSERTTKDKRVFRDWEKANKFVLKANWVDHSHARNIVNARIWTQVVRSRSDFDALPSDLKNSHIAIDGFPIKIFANGIYQGLYTWNVPKSALYGLNDDSLTNALIQGEGYDDICLFRASSDTSNKWSDETHDAKPPIIKSGWDRVLNFVYTSSDANFLENFGDYFDKQSIIDQYIFLYTACVVDNLAKNQTFFTYNSYLWYGGMYDLDGTWGLPPFHQGWYSYDTAFQNGYTVVTDGSGSTNLFYEKVGRVFASDIQTRYQELRASVLSENNIIAEFNRFMSNINSDLYAEDFAETTAGGAYTSIPYTTTDHERQIRQFVVNRLAYVDSQILTT